MLRWASEDAVAIYNRTTEGEYSSWLRAAACADIEDVGDQCKAKEQGFKAEPASEGETAETDKNK